DYEFGHVQARLCMNLPTTYQARVAVPNRAFHRTHEFSVCYSTSCARPQRHKMQLALRHGANVGARKFRKVATRATTFECVSAAVCLCDQNANRENAPLFRSVEPISGVTQPWQDVAVLVQTFIDRRRVDRNIG